MTRKTIPMPEDVKAENKMWVGRKIRKYFGKHGWHVGQVKSVWKQGANFFYRVVYEDQDKEDMDQKAVRRFCISVPRIPKATSSSSSDSALTNALRKYQHKTVEKVIAGRVIAGVVKNARYASGNRIVFELNFKNKKTEEVGLRELTRLLVAEPQPKETADAALHAKSEDEETDDVISDTDDDADDRMDTGDSAATPARTPSATQQVAVADASNHKSSPATEGTNTPIEA